MIPWTVNPELVSGCNGKCKSNGTSASTGTRDRNNCMIRASGAGVGLVEIPIIESRSVQPFSAGFLSEDSSLGCRVYRVWGKGSLPLSIGEVWLIDSRRPSVCNPLLCWFRA